MILVRKEGFEPPRPFGHKILSLARLPVPPLPQWCFYSTRCRTGVPSGSSSSLECSQSGHHRTRPSPLNAAIALDSWKWQGHNTFVQKRMLGKSPARPVRLVHGRLREKTLRMRAAL